MRDGFRPATFSGPPGLDGRRQVTHRPGYARCCDRVGRLETGDQRRRPGGSGDEPARWQREIAHGLAGRKIRILENGSVRSRAYLNISDRVLHGYDDGLLSIAFHPQWKTHPYFWVAYINKAGNLRVARFYASSYGANHVDADTGRRVPIVRYVVLGDNHYGGQLAFGIDGMLYLSTGDGGGNGDPRSNAQSKRSVRGKILRFRVIGAQASCGRIYCVPAGNPFAGKHPRQRTDLGARSARSMAILGRPENRKPLDRRCRTPRP